MTPVLRLPVLRLARAQRAWATAGAWLALGLVSAIVLRPRTVHGASDVLLGAVGSIAIPLVTFTLTGAVLGQDGLARSTRALASFGESRTRLALASIAVAGLASAIACAVLTAIAVAIAHGPSDPPLVADVLRSAWIAALAAFAYASLFSFGASFGKRGPGRVVVLVLDAMFASTSAIGVLTPRAHLRSLFGGDAVAELSARASTFSLVALAVLFAAAAVGRARR